jgi:hypothetical protein
MLYILLTFLENRCPPLAQVAHAKYVPVRLPTQNMMYSQKWYKYKYLKYYSYFTIRHKTEFIYRMRGW